MRVVWLGHSTVLVDLDGRRLLTDPVLRSAVGVLRRTATVPDAAAIGPLDAALVSHAHYDHLDLPSLRRLGRDVPLVVPRGIRRLLRRHGFTHVVELDPGDEHEIGHVTVRATDARHGGRRGLLALRAGAVGYLIRGSQRVYFAGDTDLFPGMGSLEAALDVALLPVAGWGPRVPRGHLDPVRAAEAARRLAPRIAIPVHWGTYRRLDLAWRRAGPGEAAAAFAARVAEVAPAVEVRILAIGGTLEVDPAP